MTYSDVTDYCGRVIYFATSSAQNVKDAMRDGHFGYIRSPGGGGPPMPGVPWCADSGCFGKGYPGDAGYIEWLKGMAGHLGTCSFATAPDVIGDAAATLERSLPWLPKIREIGYPAAFVGQDGLEELDVPWSEFDAFFIGGSTEWKLSEAARDLGVQARDRGKWVHMGRVNSRRRLFYADPFCDSVDGTYLCFGPKTNLPKLLGWLVALGETGTR